jgi:tetratricopeptide (TPR) repeat protein
LTIAVIVAGWLAAAGGAAGDDATAAAGSAQCRSCHADFYQKWATSHHGLAMQPFTAALAKASLTPPQHAIRIGQSTFRAEISAQPAFVRQTGADGQVADYPLAHVMGGKNVYYFLTPLERGRLQVLPVGYNLRERKWFDVPASGVRHFVDQADAPLDWRHSAFTFNTSCYACHVSQLSRNYDPATDSYHTTWGEPGINCETCHGPVAEHVRVCRLAAPGEKPKDLKIISLARFSTEQLNDSCAACHAKMSPLGTPFTFGDGYFDHFDLLTLENPDFYPDGRDLGENYTYTSWRQSRCVQSGRLECTHCHSSSGRYNFTEAEANRACLPCHAEKVANAPAHTFHKAEGAGNRCVACHMPTTGFAAMMRTDHSMRPPMPAATLAFRSPNACNGCHTDKDAAWADQAVRRWRKRDYQAPVLRWAGLIDAARKQNWTRLPEMLTEATKADREEVVAASLLRLLHACDDPARLPAVRRALADRSPLVRAAAVEALAASVSGETAEALAGACGDPVRLVRVRAAAALSTFPAAAAGGESPPSASGENAKLPGPNAATGRATDEFLSSLLARPDHWSSHYNLGNYYLSRDDARAAACFERATELEPQVLLPYVNVSIAYARLNRPRDAEAALRKALALAPDTAGAWLNLGMLLAEQERLAEAESAFRAALKIDPHLAAAAYNLAVLLARDRHEEAVRWARAAYQASPGPKYGYALAIYLDQAGQAAEAATLLRSLLKQSPTFLGGYVLLAEILQKQGLTAEARQVCRTALAVPGIPDRFRRILEEKVRELESPGHARRPPP